MIFGVGTDLVEIARVGRVYERYGKHFVERLLMPEEQPLFLQSRDVVRFLAMRFAAKEAVVKALGTGFSNGMWIRDTGIIPDSMGKPCVIFSQRGTRLCRKIGAGAAYVSLSDEAGRVVAFSVIERAEG